MTAKECLILNSFNVVPYNGVSDFFDENREEFLPLEKNNLILKQVLVPLLKTVNSIAQCYPTFKLHIKYCFLSKKEATSRYKLRPRGKYSPSLAESFFWLGSAIALPAEDFYYSRYGITKESVISALKVNGFVLDFQSDMEICLHYGQIPRESLIDLCYLA